MIGTLPQSQTPLFSQASAASPESDSDGHQGFGYLLSPKTSQLQIIEYPHIYNFVYFTYTYKFTLSIQQLDIHSLYTCCISGSKYTSSLNICRLYS